MDAQYCQSCGMPMGATNALYGTNADGSKHEAYCSSCFANGAFTSDATMEEMIGMCVPYVVSAHAGISEENARAMMRRFFPALKRWAET